MRTENRDTQVKNVVSGGPMCTMAFPQADAGLPDTTFFIGGRLEEITRPPAKT
jgi:hypothetical protein